MRHLALVAVAAAFTGCGETEKEGSVGGTLEGRDVRVTVDRVVPREGGLVGVRVEACTDVDKAIKAYDFAVERDGGAPVPPTRPQRLYGDEFGFVRSGCEAGWIVFAAARPTAVTFRYDDTGSAQPGDRQNHLRFRWNL